MRKLFLIAMLASSAATPALAQRWNDTDGNNNHHRADRSEQRSEQRAERPRGNGGDRANFVPPAAVQMQRAERPAPVMQAPPRAVFEQQQAQRQQRWSGRMRQVDQAAQPSVDWRQGDRRQWQGRVGDETGAIPRPRIVTPQDMAVYRSRQRDVYARDRDRYRDTRVDSRWRQDWREDHRYDWRRFRERNRSVFRVGIYYDPFGWNYQRFGIGFRLNQGYYSQNYWISDPWQYRLPEVYGPYRWVRYYDDALLVDIYTGEVVDTIYDFFW